MKIIKILFLFILCFICSCNQAEKTRQRLYGHVSYMASDELGGRLACTRGDSLARDYIIQNFRNFNLIPLFDNNSFVQPFAMLTDISVKQNILNIEDHSIKYSLSHKSDFVINYRSGDGSGKGKVVFIGYGVHSPNTGYDDFNKIDLKDKIVISYLYPPKGLKKEFRKEARKLNRFEKAELIYKFGGRALISVFPTSDKGTESLNPIDSRETFSQNRTKSEIPILRISYGSFEKLLANQSKRIDEIDLKLNKGEASQAFLLNDLIIEFDIETKYIYKNGYNIAGYLEGTDTTKAILIGAHYDHIGSTKKKTNNDSIRNGADDNASGVALMIELARHFSTNEKLRGNLIFTGFGAEEYHMIGSKYFIENMPKKPFQLKYMINYDMLGRMRNDSLFLWGSKMLIDEFVNTAQPHSLINFCQNRSFGGDAQPFYDAGISAVTLTTGFHEDLHKVTDEIEKINFNGMMNIFDFSKIIITELNKLNDN